MHSDTTVIIGDRLIVEQCNKDWLRGYVPYDKKSWIQIVKNIPGRKWNVEEKCWELPYTQQTIAVLDLRLGEVVNLSISDIDTDSKRIFIQGGKE